MFSERPPLLSPRASEAAARRADDASRALDIPAISARLTLSRRPEMSVEELARWFAPKLAHLRPPTGMAGFEEALDLLVDAIERGVRVGVFGDYDADGVTSTSIVSTFLRAVGVDVVAAVASRSGGYGFHIEAARELQEAKCGLVITADCGTSDHESLAWLRGAGVKTIVIDHHQVPATDPPADAFINPWQRGCAFEFKFLCSAGVAFYLCASLRTRLRAMAGGERSIPDPRAWLDLAAIGTVCDMVPLIGENRVLVHQGLRSPSMRRRPGLQALLRRGRVGAADEVTENFVAFTVGPRLNAPGRIGPADPALQLLCAGSAKEAAPILRAVEEINRARKRFQQEVVAEAGAAIDGDPSSLERHAIALSSPRWMHGVVGIAASSLASRYGRPAFVMSEDEVTGELRGSARTYGAIDVHRVLKETSSLLIRHGGHTAAAGFSLERAQLGAFTRAVEEAVTRQKEDLVEDPAVYFDGEFGLGDVVPALLRDIRRAGPFGQGFAAPALLCEGARVRMRKVFAEQHLELVLEQAGTEHRAVVFGEGAAPINPGDRVSFLYEPEFDLYRGSDRVSLRILRIWKSAS